MQNRLRILLFCLCIATLAWSAAGQSTGKPPVIVIPGILGTELVNPATGKTSWFSVRRDKNDDLRLPMTSPVLIRNRDDLVPRDIIRKVDVPVLPDVEVYEKLIEALEKKGYKEASWNKPVANDVFYVFPYDWRRDNVESAHLLVKKITDAKRALKNPNLKFDIIAHSMGGLIARYAAMYGGAELPVANPRPNWWGARNINKLLMFGTPNAGAFSAFEGLLKGAPIVADRKLPLIDDLRSEDVLSNPSAFQLLPHNTGLRFLDENLKLIKIDIYDPATWKKYGWGAVNDTKFLAKLSDAPQLASANTDIKPEKLAKDAGLDDRLIAGTTSRQVDAYFASALDRARRFHRALGVQSKSLPYELYAYGGSCAPTLDAVLLTYDEKAKRWQTHFEARDIKTTAGREIKKEEVKAAMFLPGDGRVTRRSLLAADESIVDGKPKFSNAAFPVKSSFFGCGLHTTLFLDGPIQEAFLSTLVVEKAAQP